MARKLCIFGASQYAKLVAYYGQDMGYDFEAYVVDKKYCHGGQFSDRPLLSVDAFLDAFSPDDTALFIALGYREMRQRCKVYARMKAYGYTLPNIISKQTELPKNTSIGDNNIILPGVIIEPFVNIGDNNIFWSNSTICHDTVIGSHNFFAASSTIGGSVTIASVCFFGFSSTVLQDNHVANETLLAAQSLLNKNTLECGRYMGIPAKLVSIHEQNGIML